VTSKSDRMGLRHAPMAFTEQGIAMLSSVLNSERAIRVNIAVMRTFVQLRGLLASHEGLARKLEDLEKKYDTQFKVVFDAIRELMTPPEKPLVSRFCRRTDTECMVELPCEVSQMNGCTLAMRSPSGPRFGARCMSRFAPRVPV